jgi:hypothetical protein
MLPIKFVNFNELPPNCLHKNVMENVKQICNSFVQHTSDNGSYLLITPDPRAIRISKSVENIYFKIVCNDEKFAKSGSSGILDTILSSYDIELKCMPTDIKFHSKLQFTGSPEMLSFLCKSYPDKKEEEIKTQLKVTLNDKVIFGTESITEKEIINNPTYRFKITSDRYDVVIPRLDEILDLICERKDKSNINKESDTFMKPIEK